MTLTNMILIMVLVVCTQASAQVRDKKWDNSGAHARTETHTTTVQHMNPTHTETHVVTVQHDTPSRPQIPHVHHSQTVHTTTTTASPRIYASRPDHTPVQPSVHHHNHHGTWHPSYNFYDHHYHFYPYVNVVSLVSLPAQYDSVSFDGGTYYYDQFSFYQDQGDSQGYILVPPPIGAIVPSISPSAQQRNINDVIYYYYNGIYYQPVAGGYQVVEPAA